jgi:hypothetical protein
VAGDGTPLDPGGIRLNNSDVGGLQFQTVPGSAIFDGDQYIVSWILAGTDPTSPLFYPMATRIGLDGSILDPDPEGLLLAAQPTVRWSDGKLAVTATKSLLFWYEPYDQTPGRILAQAMFQR